jgi:rRNA-processing protein FCF1
MKIILDSNVVFNDPLLESTHLRALVPFLSSKDIELCIPEVVLEEIVRHFKSDYKDALVKLKKATRLAAVIGLELNHLPPVEEAVEQYRSKLQERLNDIPARIIGIPGIDAREFLHRDLNQRKPFDSTGRGFRDSLIWESVLAELEDHSEDVALISNDNAFSSPDEDNEDTLLIHPDLHEDLKAREIPSSRIALFRSLHAFTSKFPPIVAKAAYRRGQDIEGTVAEGINVEEILQKYGDYAAERVHQDLPFLIPIPEGWIDSVSFLRWPEDPAIIYAFEITAGTIHVQARSSIVFDALITSSQDAYHQLFEFSKGKPIIVGALSWLQDAGVYHFNARMSIFADFMFAWVRETSEVLGFQLGLMAFSEKEMD